MVVLILLIPLVWLLLLYSIRWVDASGRADRGVDGPTWLQAACRPDGKPIFWFLREYLYCLLHASCYLAGLAITIRNRFAPGSWPIDETASSRDPIILVHGLYSNPGCMLILKWRLARAGYRNVFLFGYSSFETGFDEIVNRLRDRVLEVRERLPGRKIHLVGHSMGGLIAVSLLGTPTEGDPWGKIVCLGSPFGGTRMAFLSLSTLARNLRPGHPFLRGFDRPTTTVSVLSIRSDFDAIVLPAENADYPGGEGERKVVEGLGHAGLCFNRGVADLIQEVL